MVYIWRLDNQQTNLEMNGQNGKLHLDLPMDAQPKRHFFNQSANNLSDSSLSISLHVLQVFEQMQRLSTRSMIQHSVSSGQD